jgi:hypothetical protein
MKNPFASKNRLLLTTSHLDSSRVPLIRKARQMAKLHPGWSYGEGVPITHVSIAAAEGFILIASYLELRADVFPNLDGGCAVAFYRAEERLEVSISPNGRTFGLKAECGVGFEFEETESIENATLKQIGDCLGQLTVRNNLWKLSASSISGSTTEQANDLEMSCTRIHQTQRTPRPLQTAEGGSLFSKPFVLVGT